MGKFDWAVDLAKKLIDENGEAVTLTVFSSNIPNPQFPNEASASTPTLVPARAVFLNYNTKEAGQTYADGTDIHRDDKKVLMAAKGLIASPNLQGTIEREDGSVFRIIKVLTLDPNGQKIFHEAQVRR